MATTGNRDITAAVCSRLLSQLGELFQCELAGERVQIRTPFLMPDGHQVDLYWRHTDRGEVISDLGDTYGWLFVNGAHDELTTEQDATYNAVCSAYGVERLGVTLLAHIDEGQLADAVIRLGQAITMVSHTLDIGQKPIPATAESPAKLTSNRIVTVIKQRRNHGWTYQRKVKINGQYGQDWQMDFMVKTPHQRAALMALHGRKHRGWQRRAIEHVFTVFTDLAPILAKSPTPVRPVSVIDDNDVNWYTEPVELLADVSKVVWLSDPDNLLAAID